jgi:hypothetical protein
VYSVAAYLVVLIDGKLGVDEIQAVIDALNDPLWEEVQGIDGFGREDLVELARAGVTTYIAARPEHAAAIDPLIEEIELQTLE